MTETRTPATSRNQTAALVGLLTVVVLVLASPVGVGFVLPYLGDTLGTVLDGFLAAVTTTWSWIWNSVIVSVCTWWAA